MPVLLCRMTSYISMTPSIAGIFVSLSHLLQELLYLYYRVAVNLWQLGAVPENLEILYRKVRVFWFSLVWFFVFVVGFFLNLCLLKRGASSSLACKDRCK